MNIVEHNRKAWNKESKEGSPWSIPVRPEQIAQARRGQWDVILTPLKPVPKSWFGPLQGKQVLGLASGGGQQMPLLAAAGAIMTSFDNSEEQLAKDLQVAQQEGLDITTVQGDMADLSAFDNDRFDVIFHPVSNCFVPDVNQVWKECFRVLKPGGRLLSGFMNPALYLFDHDKAEASGIFEVEFPLPYSDLDLDKQRQNELIKKDETIQFSHTLNDLIGGQLTAGFTLHDFYEDKWTNEATPLNQYMSTSMATLAIKPA